MNMLFSFPLYSKSSHEKDLGFLKNKLGKPFLLNLFSDFVSKLFKGKCYVPVLVRTKKYAQECILLKLQTL